MRPIGYTIHPIRLHRAGIIEKRGGRWVLTFTGTNRLIEHLLRETS